MKLMECSNSYSTSTKSTRVIDCIKFLKDNNSVNTRHIINIEYINNKQNFIPININIETFKANPIKILSRLLNTASKYIDLYLCDVNGNFFDDSNTNKSHIIVAIDKSEYDFFKTIIVDFNNVLKSEFSLSSENIQITLSKSDITIDSIFSEKTTNKIIDLLFLIPDGVQSVSTAIPNLIESYSKLYSIETITDKIFIDCNVRGYARSSRMYILFTLDKLATLIDCGFEIDDLSTI